MGSDLFPDTQQHFVAGDKERKRKEKKTFTVLSD